MMQIERQRVRIGLRLVVVVRARQIHPALVSSNLDQAGSNLTVYRGEFEKPGQAREERAGERDSVHAS